MGPPPKAIAICSKGSGGTGWVGALHSAPPDLCHSLPLRYAAKSRQARDQDRVVSGWFHGGFAASLTRRARAAGDGAGYAIAMLTGDTTAGGFELNGGPALLRSALVIACFVVMNKWLGGTVFKRLFGIAGRQPRDGGAIDQKRLVSPTGFEPVTY